MARDIGFSTTLMMTIYTFSSALFPASHLVHLSDRGEYDILDAIDLLIQSARRSMRSGWQIDMGYFEAKEKAERLLQDKITNTVRNGWGNHGVSK